MININNKIPEGLKKEFQLHIEPEKIIGSRVMCVLGIILYLVFIVVDMYALKSALYEAFVIRLAVISGLIIAFLFTFSASFIKYYQLIQTIPYSLGGIGICLMILISSPSDSASNIYFAGLLLVMTILFSWSHLHMASIFINAIFMISLYVGIELSKNSETTYILSTLLPNCFFLISAAIIGFVTQIMRNQYLRQNFLLQQTLKDDYNKKSAEAKDNQYLANHDPLTDLPNRRYLTELLEKSLEFAATNDKVLVIMFVDLNGFKQINDVYGHNAGDEVLVIVAKRLELAIRQGDHLSRLGGDEYVMGLMMDKDNLDEIESMANKFIDIISQPMNVEGLRVKVGASVGVAAYPIHGNNIDALIEIADQRMYQAKKRKADYSLTNDSIINDEQEAVVIFPGNAKKER